MLTIALSKGRILDDTLPLFERFGIYPKEDPAKSRRLIIESNKTDVRFLIIRASDVATYVQYGAADAGVVGKDLLLEHSGDGLYELLDLGIACCRMVVAEPKAFKNSHRSSATASLRIATKYPKITAKHFAAKGIQTEIVKLYGSMELAPLVGLADSIVDLVDTGNTMLANGLEEVELIANISSRFVVNRASMKLKREALNSIVKQMKLSLDERN